MYLRLLIPPDRSVNRARSPNPFTGCFPLALLWAANFCVCRHSISTTRGEKNSSPQPGPLFALGDRLAPGYEIPAV
jgi:hypothetical protein